MKRHNNLHMYVHVDMKNLVNITTFEPRWIDELSEEQRANPDYSLIAAGIYETMPLVYYPVDRI